MKATKLSLYEFNDTLEQDESSVSSDLILIALAFSDFNEKISLGVSNLPWICILTYARLKASLNTCINFFLEKLECGSVERKFDHSMYEQNEDL